MSSFIGKFNKRTRIEKLESEVLILKEQNSRLVAEFKRLSQHPFFPQLLQDLSEPSATPAAPPPSQSAPEQQ